MLIPSAIRKAMRAEPGQELIMHYRDGELHIYTKESAIRRAREYVADLIPAKVDLIDHLTQERRREAARESNHSG